jgi:RNA ligase (TIGR02306 family)
MRKLASIQKILEVAPIENADNIKKVRINGWWVVVPKTANYKAGDLVVYFEIDSMLPELDGNTPFQFLINKTSRKKVLDNGETSLVHVLRTMCFRGTYSHGFVLPIDVLLHVEGNILTESHYRLTSRLSKKNSVANLDEIIIEHDLHETDVTELLGIEKYEKPLPACLSGMARGLFPSFIPKTDQERVQNMTNNEELFNRIANSEQWEVTEKLDGSSATIYIVVDEEQPKNAVLLNSRLGVCSLSFDLKETSDNTHWKVVRKHFPMDGNSVLRMDSMARHSPMAFHGELMGNGINENSLKMPGHKLFIFNIYDINAKAYLPPDEARDYAEKEGMSYVPVLHRDFIIPTEYGNQDKAQELVEYLLQMAEGKMALNKNKNREGIVFKSKDGKFSFKVISNSWLLKNE